MLKLQLVWAAAGMTWQTACAQISGNKAAMTAQLVLESTHQADPSATPLPYTQVDLCDANFQAA